MPAPRKGAACPCGCGQPDAKTSRTRKLACPHCPDYIVRASRAVIARGLPCCPCGAELEPVCRFDAAAAPGDVGADAIAALEAREDRRLARAEVHAPRGVGIAPSWFCRGCHARIASEHAECSHCRERGPHLYVVAPEPFARKSGAIRAREAARKGAARRAQAAERAAAAKRARDDIPF